MFAALDKSRTIAGPGYSRWLVPPAALCVHLSIGQVYAWSVFNEPLTRVIGVSQAAPDDWSSRSVIVIFSLAIVFLGLSAAFGGKWLERVGPRAAMLASATCFSGGFFVAALGVWLHAMWLVYLGYGVIGGCGLGLGYISPVGTLIRWFPDRPGMATGMAIMGFGGGAMIGSPLGVALMKRFATETSVGVVETFATMGVVYGLFMLVGALTVRIPPAGWKPAGYSPATTTAKGAAGNNVHADQAIRTPQFYLLWVMLCFNVTAGIAILGSASNMLQDIFGATSEAGAGFVGLLSIASMAGRIGWSSASDFLGRKATYAAYFGFGAVLYSLLPTLGARGAQAGFVLASFAIMTMYGGGFATIPAYLRDAFGVMHVSAIHGRLLTAWSTAGVLGPVLLTQWAERQKGAGYASAEAYGQVMYFMAGLLAIGFACNWMMAPVAAKHHFQGESAKSVGAAEERSSSSHIGRRTSGFAIAGAWLLVLTPLAWGMYHTLVKVASLF